MPHYGGYLAQRERLRFSAVHILWSGLLFVMLIGLWWILWGLGQAPRERWSFFVLLYLLVGPVLIYLPSILLLPDVRLQDPGGRELRYAFTDEGVSIDAALLHEGLAIAWRRDGSFREELITIEEEAEAAGTGCLWSG